MIPPYLPSAGVFLTFPRYLTECVLSDIATDRKEAVLTG
jgi:hypothetical protein